MMTDDPSFYAWLDGELGGAEAEEMAAKVAADPALTALAEQHRALGARLRDAFGPIAADPVPASLLAATQAPSARVIDMGKARAERAQTEPSARFPLGWGRQLAAMAAALALGLLAGPLLFAGRDASVTTVGGQMVAGGALKDSLSAQLASAPAAAGPRIALTFRDHDGAICRSFIDGGASGLACRDGDQWRIRGLFQSGEGQGQNYRMAAGLDPALAALIDARIAGEPLDAKTEQAAKAKDWR